MPRSWRPKQRNSDAEKADLKRGKVPEERLRKPAKLRQKDRDARWAVKFPKAKAGEEGRRSSATSPRPPWATRTCLDQSPARLRPRLERHQRFGL
ncbi:hypothetical protein NKI79_31925 [Mesorhizobium sp. M0340]|uniref:hypothetical protein n=1 Tax=Mesorhizobium sp. M0340 TaxID=2956939 RepID=UPI00333B3C3F